MADNKYRSANTERRITKKHKEKGSFVAADERKTIEFVDVTVKSEPHENKAEELVLFLERYYQSGLSEQEIRKAVNITAMLVKEKAEKLGARLVLSSSYKNVLENKNYVLTNFYMYISACELLGNLVTRASEIWRDTAFFQGASMTPILLAFRLYSYFYYFWIF